MAYEQKNLTGQLFKNARKTEESHPNATGSALINGVEYWVNAWTKKDKNGQPWQSLSFKPKEKKEQPKVENSFDDPDGDIPF
jgi:hypothetical protein